MNDKKRYTIAVLIGGVHTYFPQRIIAGIRDAAQEFDVNICFFLGTHTKVFFQNMLGDDIGNVYDYQFNTIYDYSLLSGVDGIIINYGTLGVYLNDNDLDAFAGKFNSIPVVILTETITLDNCHYLISNNYQGIRMIMDHLINDHGYKKILFVAGPDGNTDAAERKQAYLDAMEEAQLPFDASMIERGDYSEFVDSQVETLLDAHPDADALVFSNDEMAFSGYRVCRRRGLQVGKDIAITGYDDCELAKNMNPPLTTISQDGFAIGRQSVIDLLDRFKGREVVSRRVPVNYIQRESCGCASAREIRNETFESLSKERKLLSAELTQMRDESLNFQRRSWFVPFMARDLNNYVSDEERFCYRIMANLQRISSRNMYLFLLGSPIHYVDGEPWTAPDKLYLASYHCNGNVVSYYPYDRPVINKEHRMTEFINDGSPHQYTFFLLFSCEKQYGLLACDIDQGDFSFFYVISLQLGLSLRYQESSKIEAAHLLEMSRHIELMQERNRELDIMSGFDELTGLLNLRGFTEQVNSLQPQHDSLHAYMMYGDLDHLKEINDNWGHPEGNYAIRSAGQILKKCLRDSDILGRIGGDEFLALILSESPDFEQTFRTRVTQACQALNESSGKPFYVEISLGIHAFDFSGNTDIQEIISLADEQLYEHKKFRRESIQK